MGPVSLLSKEALHCSLSNFFDGAAIGAAVAAGAGAGEDTGTAEKVLKKFQIHKRLYFRIWVPNPK